MIFLGWGRKFPGPAFLPSNSFVVELYFVYIFILSYHQNVIFCVVHGLLLRGL